MHWVSTGNCVPETCSLLAIHRPSFDYNCLNVYFLNNIKKCVCKEITENCIGTHYNNCLKIYAPVGGQCCKVCNVSYVTYSIDAIQEVDFNCFNATFLEKFRECLCQSPETDCPGDFYKKCFQKLI
ncbi:hypothetical protein RN001_015030 [Aquatica leii]|uniref:Uncharacterized protein n=1 Tax=Aquatica leii TaxID=1421715 RepID=A0AAN7S6G9_9COLE|nr:hypothetical protein RN001_015030 [Aquatica leii]